MEFDPKHGNGLWDLVIGGVGYLLFRNKFAKWVFSKLVGMLIKPLYDFAIRKTFMKIEAIRAAKAQTKLEQASTIEEAKKAVDEIP